MAAGIPAVTPAVTPGLIPAEYRDLFGKPCIAYLGAVLRSGRVLVNPVWCELEGQHLNLVLGAEGGKVAILHRDPRVTLCITDPETPNRYLELRGRVTSLSPEGGAALLARLNRRYEEAADPVPAGSDPATGYLKVVFKPEEVRHYTG